MSGQISHPRGERRQRPQRSYVHPARRGHRPLNGRSIDVARTGSSEEHAKEPLQDEHQLTFGASEVQDVDECPAGLAQQATDLHLALLHDRVRHRDGGHVAFVEVGERRRRRLVQHARADGVRGVFAALERYLGNARQDLAIVFDVRGITDDEDLRDSPPP